MIEICGCWYVGVCYVVWLGCVNYLDDLWVVYELICCFFCFF